jgi:G:T-mismatch repair DNA endonuclease (very short patch repair protein)
LPKRNRAFWREKFEANRRRDARVARALRKRGMRVIVVWNATFFPGRKWSYAAWDENYALGE